MADACLELDDLQSVHFLKNGSEIPVWKLMDDIYSPLDLLIGCNRDFQTFQREHSSPDHAALVQAAEIEHQEKVSSLYPAARKFVDTAGAGLEAIVIEKTSDQGTSHITRYPVKPRTNYDDTALKRPNIIILETDDGKRLIVREARYYANDDFINDRTKRAFSHFSSSIPGWLTPLMKDRVHPRDIVSIPEPHLLLTLEDMHRLKDPTPRVTPRMRVLAISGDTMYYIRDSLSSLADSSINPETFGKYFGTLHGLGLMDFVDPNVDHFCTTGREVVNIDPDFIVYGERKSHTQQDWRHIKELLYSGVTGVSPIMDALGHFRARDMELIRSKLQGKEFLDYVNPTLTEYSSLDQLKLASFQVLDYNPKKWLDQWKAQHKI